MAVNTNNWINTFINLRTFPSGFLVSGKFYTNLFCSRFILLVSRNGLHEETPQDCEAIYYKQVFFTHSHKSLSQHAFKHVDQLKTDVQYPNAHFPIIVWYFKGMWKGEGCTYHTVCVQVRGQLARVGSHLPGYGLWESTHVIELGSKDLSSLMHVTRPILLNFWIEINRDAPPQVTLIHVFLTDHCQVC